LNWINAWNEFVVTYKKKNKSETLPGFPIWADEFVHENSLRIPSATPEWKRNFLQKNAHLYTSNKVWIDSWLAKWNNLEDFPPSRRKLEWQAQNEVDLWNCLMHFRPSGIRAKKLTYVPALVAITQTSIIGPLRRRISVREAARLQGFPETFSFEGQPSPQSYKQLGNAVNVGVIYNVIKAQVKRDQELLARKSELVNSILDAPASPDDFSW
jgi:DNA (cytosine-5)-methyltransferase 1